MALRKDLILSVVEGRTSARPAQSLSLGRFGVAARLQRWRAEQPNWRIILFCYLALAPVLALFAYVRVVPIVWSIILSFYKWNLISPLKPFIRFANYQNLPSDDNFLVALKNTAIYSGATVLFSTLLALPLAVFLARKGRLSVFYQTVYFLPVITPMVPMAIAWKWIYDYNYGLLNYALSFFGIGAVAWLTDPHNALWAIIIMSVWKVLGYNLILFLVGISNIPETCLEAHSANGASAWQRFRDITQPPVNPT